VAVNQAFAAGRFVCGAVVSFNQFLTKAEKGGKLFWDFSILKKK